MTTIRTRLAMSIWGLGMIVFSTPAWADRDPRMNVPPIPAEYSVELHGASPHGHGMELIPGSKPLMGGGVSADSSINGKFDRGGVRVRTEEGAYPSTNVTRPSEILKPDSNSAGIPLWRW